MDIKKFAQEVFETVQDTMDTYCVDYDTAITKMFIDCMEDCDEVSSPDICMFSHPRERLSAYDLNEEADSLDLFLFVRANSMTARADSKVESGFKCLRAFYDQCLKRKASFGGNESEFDSEVQEAISLIRESKGNVDVVRFYILTDGMVTITDEIDTPDKDEEGVICEYHIWDIAKLYRQEQINNGNNTIEIDFETDQRFFVKSKNNTLVAPKIQCLKVDDDNPYVETYVAIIQGDVLAKIYNEYSSVLLEKNVRAYLRNKSKVNQRIMSTIKNKPEMFFSYNNGISTTASDVKTKGTGHTQYITQIKDWQIVNGAQTTASIACAKNCDLSKVFVQMKVSRVRDEEKYEETVRAISLSANSQTAIKPSDFDSGDEFLVKLEKLSRKEMTPVSKQYWFFERMRGQYTDLRASCNRVEEDKFKNEYPKEKMLTKIDIARVAVIWSMKPHIACNSREKCFTSYLSSLKKNETEIDSAYWHNIIALSILYKEIEECFKTRCGQNGFKSRTTAYTMSAISYLTNQNLNLDYIWKHEKVQPQLGELIERLVVKINYQLDLDNSRSFTKNAKCWEDIKEEIKDIPVPSALFLSADDCIDDNNEEDKKIVDQANSIPIDYWKKLLEWNKVQKFLRNMEKTAVSNFVEKKDAGRIIRKNSAEKVMAVKKKAEAFGFSMEAASDGVNE